jgi:hypothetical protein
MKSEHFLKEGFVEDASDVHADHEVQMARSDLFHAAEDALVLHKLLRNVSEQQGLEGWVAAKITLASDYLKTVREYIEYELMTAASEQPMLPIAEGSGSKEKQKTPYRDINSPEYRKAAEKQKEKMDKEKAAEPGKKLLGKIEKQEVEEAANDYFKRRKDEEDRIAGTKAPAKRTPQQTDYAKRRAQEKKTEQGVAEGSSCNMTMEGKSCPTHGLKKCPGYKSNIEETTAGSVATVVNPTPKNKSKVGTLFGGTYKQKKSK